MRSREPDVRRHCIARARALSGFVCASSRELGATASEILADKSAARWRASVHGEERHARVRLARPVASRGASLELPGLPSDPAHRRMESDPASSRPIHALFASKPAPATSSAIADAVAACHAGSMRKRSAPP